MPSLVWTKSRIAHLSPGAMSALILGFVVAIHLPSLGQLLLEAHAFRQTQTAWTALIYHQSGIDLLRPAVPVFSPADVIPFEFPLFQALAALLMDFGLSAEVALRATCLATFVLTAELLRRLVSYVADERAGMIALVAFVLTPVGLLWSRTATIEYLATAVALGYIYMALRWHDGGGWPRYVVALFLGVLALLVKITTGVLFVLPILALLAVTLARRPDRQGQWLKEAAGLIVLMVVPLAAALTWTAYADAIKAESPLTAWLMSGRLGLHNFGTIQQRLDPSTWKTLAVRYTFLLAGGSAIVWFGLAAAGALAVRHRLYVLAFLGSAVAAPIIFVSLYINHDYYLAAVSPAVAAGIALGSWWLVRSVPARTARVAGACLTAAWVVTLFGMAGYWGQQYASTPVDPSNALPAAAAIGATAAADEAVVVVGRDWDPAALYYAGHKGLMIRQSLADTLSEPTLSLIKSFGYRHLYFCPRSAVGCDPPIDLQGDVTQSIPVSVGHPDFTFGPAPGIYLVRGEPNVIAVANATVTVGPPGCVTIAATGVAPEIILAAPPGSQFAFFADLAGTANVFLDRAGERRMVDQLSAPVSAGGTYALRAPAGGSTSWMIRFDPPPGTAAGNLCAVEWV